MECSERRALTLDEPSRHLNDGVVHEIVHGQETRVIVTELHATANLRQDSGNLGQVLPGLDIDGRGDDVERFRGAKKEFTTIAGTRIGRGSHDCGVNGPVVDQPTETRSVLFLSSARKLLPEGSESLASEVPHSIWNFVRRVDNRRHKAFAPPL